MKIYNKLARFFMLTEKTHYRSVKRVHELLERATAIDGHVDESLCKGINRYSQL